MYKLLKDKNNEFQCEIKLEGTSAKDAKVRLFLEADGCEYSFTGQIKDGECTVPLGKLKRYGNLLESGKIRLEIIADDTLFTPYESEYQLEQEKKVTVEVKQPDTSTKKTLVEVKVQEPVTVAKKNPITEIKDYFSSNTDFDGTIKSFTATVRNKSHKKYFNTICEANGLDKMVVLRQILK